jgi:hypothetical protein
LLNVGGNVTRNPAKLAGFKIRAGSEDCHGLNQESGGKNGGIV